MFGWTAAHIPLVLLLPFLLAASAFFSGSETALFGLSEPERMKLRRSGTFAGRTVGAMLSEQRMLLITILLGNMTINVLYFVISSVLLLAATEMNAIGELLLAAASLVVIILFGEVMPKVVANAHRDRIVSLIAPPLFAVHKAIGPVRVVLDRLIVAPLSRLTSPAEAPPKLTAEELAVLLELSGSEGVIDVEEQRLLNDVLHLKQLRVRDVMTPRVRIEALPIDASREHVEATLGRTRFAKYPVYEGDLDHIVGVLNAKTYLLDAEADEGIARWVGPARFVPDVASLDHLLDHFRSTGTQLAIVVDEFGGTAGLVAMEDVVEEIVGDIVGEGEPTSPRPRMIGLGTWRLGGELSVRDWASAFGQELVSPRVTTLGGLIFERLGRVPRKGDVVEFGNVRLEVEAIDESRVVSAVMTLMDEPDEAKESGA